MVPLKTCSSIAARWYHQLFRFHWLCWPLLLCVAHHRHGSAFRQIDVTSLILSQRRWGTIGHHLRLFTAAFKLQMIEYAEEHGKWATGCKFDVEENRMYYWIQQREALITINRSWKQFHGKSGNILNSRTDLLDTSSTHEETATHTWKPWASQKTGQNVRPMSLSKERLCQKRSSLGE